MPKRSKFLFTCITLCKTRVHLCLKVDHRSRQLCPSQSKSHWHAYLNLVPNNEDCGPPMLWSKADRARLLEGTCMSQLVESDLKRIEDDFRNVVLPLMKKNPQIFR